MLFFSVLQSRLVLHEVLIAVFMVVTTPVTLMLLARAALYRDRSEGSDEVPPPPLPSPPNPSRWFSSNSGKRQRTVIERKCETRKTRPVQSDSDL